VQTNETRTGTPFGEIEHPAAGGSPLRDTASGPIHGPDPVVESPAVPEGFRWLSEDRADAGPAEPSVQRGAASHWPAVRDWTLQRLAELDPERDVQVVVWDRELGSTRFERANLGAYLRSVAVDDATSRDRYLKEFDLLGEFPRLRRDLLTAELFLSGNIVCSSAWIGPTAAHTGLHHDLLDKCRGAGRRAQALPAVPARDGREVRCAVQKI